jgi:hypothetical protein
MRLLSENAGQVPNRASKIKALKYSCDMLDSQGPLMVDFTE